MLGPTLLELPSVLPEAELPSVHASGELLTQSLLIELHRGTGGRDARQLDGRRRLGVRRGPGALFVHAATLVGRPIRMLQAASPRRYAKLLHVYRGTLSHLLVFSGLQDYGGSTAALFYFIDRHRWHKGS